MHLVLLIQPQFPESERPGEVEKFLKHIAAKQYSAKHLHPSWNRIRPREIRIFDLTIPEKIEKEVIADLQTHEASKLMRLPKIMDSKILMALGKKILGIEGIEREEKKPKKQLGPKERFDVYLSMIGKVKDEYKGKLELI